MVATALLDIEDAMGHCQHIVQLQFRALGDKAQRSRERQRYHYGNEASRYSRLIC